MKLRKPDNPIDEEMLRKNAEILKNLSDKIDKVESSIGSKGKMDDLLVEVEKRKAEDAKKNDAHSHDGHSTHSHNLSFDKDGIATCVGKDCGKKFAMIAVPSIEDWNKDMPNPEMYAERNFDPNKVHDIYQCSDCATKIHGPKRKDIGNDNKLDSCPFCQGENSYFKPVNLKELGKRINRMK